jgi:hypothetical protein
MELAGEAPCGGEAQPATVCPHAGAHFGQSVRVNWLRSAGPDRRSALIAGVWLVAVTVALIVTLDSLREDDFDGLNNMLQIPFALPWFLLPVPAITGVGHIGDAWVTAGMGWLNGVLILFFLPEWVRRRGRA